MTPPQPNTNPASFPCPIPSHLLTQGHRYPCHISEWNLGTKGWGQWTLESFPVPILHNPPIVYEKKTCSWEDPSPSNITHGSQEICIPESYISPSLYCFSCWDNSISGGQQIGMRGTLYPHSTRDQHSSIGMEVVYCHSARIIAFQSIRKESISTTNYILCLSITLC